MIAGAGVCEYLGSMVDRTGNGDEHDPRALAQRVRALLDATMTGLVSGDAAIMARAAVPPTSAEVTAWLDDLLSKQDTYRDAALAILAFPAAAARPLDVTRRLPSDRAVTGYLEKLLDNLDIRARRDALQTIAKGSASLIGRARESWNELLAWAGQQQDTTEIERAFYYLAKGIAATARNLPELPRIDATKLTFAALTGLFDEMLATPSGGAHEQFIFAALLDAAVEEAGRGRVATKSLSAADAPGSTAADVQILDGGIVAEAYEVTANEWRSKVGQALQILGQHDLRRVHIVASAAGVTKAELRAEIPTEADVSVLDVREEVHSLTHRLQRPGRRAALMKLYEHLAQRQPRDDLVGRFVELLNERSLIEA